jgi:transposase-like protein
MEQDKVKKSRRYFDQQFKVDAVRLLAESGKPISEVAQNLGINRNQLDHWKKQLLGKKSPQAAFPGSGNLGSEKKGLEELRRELARVKLLKASRNGYYKFRHHIVSAQEIANVRLLEQIKIVHQESRGIYGSPRVHRELVKNGNACGRHRVARLMAKEGIVGKIRRRFRTTTRQRKGARPAPDLVKRYFAAVRPHQLWTSDITYIWTNEGWLYLAVILDVFSRTIVGAGPPANGSTLSWCVRRSSGPSGNTGQDCG